MSKKKNTLRDLDEFLKQQAASLVKPEPVSLPPAVVEETAKVVTETPVVTKSEATIDSILNDLKAIASKDPSFRKNFYDTIIKTLEACPASSAEDKMLINTALFLKGGDRWKETIREYWKNKS